MGYLIKRIFLFIISLFLVLGTPALAQKTTIDLPDFSIHDTPILSPFKVGNNSATVILDGRELFQVGNFESEDNPVTATRRANTITKKLEKAVKEDSPPQLDIKNNNGSPTIFLNDNYLFTVTQKEVSQGKTPEKTANEIKNKIEKSIRQAQKERNQVHQYRLYIIATTIVVVALILNRLLNLLKVHPLPKAWLFLIPFIGNNERGSEQDLSFFSKSKILLAKIVLWSATIYWVTDLFPATRKLRYDVLSGFWQILNYPLFSVSNENYSIIRILILVALFWGLFSAIKTLTQFLRTNILHRTAMSRGSQEVIFIITKYALLAIGTVILLQIWGLNLSSLTILGSALGVGIGFGFQDIAKNFASGLVLLFERSVQVGDFIEVNGHKGMVERVGARSIVLRTLDRISIIVPNSSLLADEVVNWTHENSISRLHLPVGVAYGSDTELVKSVLLKAAGTHIEVLRHPAPQVLFDSLGDSSLNFILLVWVSEPSHQAFIKSDLYFQIDKLFREHEIDIPFPQRDINFRNPNLEISLSGEVENALLKWLGTSNTSNGNQIPPQNNQKSGI